MVDCTLILGATPNPVRYAYRAAALLQAKGYCFIPVGIKQGEVMGKPILSRQLAESLLHTHLIHTVTLYIGARHQPEWYDFLFKLRPKRIIFNPGTENPELMQLARQAGIDAIEACTLVLLQTGQYDKEVN